MHSEISFILIQCDIRHGYLVYVNDCHMTENWYVICYVIIKTTFNGISYESDSKTDFDDRLEPLASFGGFIRL